MEHIQESWKDHEKNSAPKLQTHLLHMACEGSQPLPPLPSGHSSVSLKETPDEMLYIPLPPQTLLVCSLVRQPSSSGLQGEKAAVLPQCLGCLWQSSWVPPWGFSFHTVHCHAFICCGLHPDYFLLDDSRALQREGHLCFKSCAQSQGFLRTAHCLVVSTEHGSGPAGLPTNESWVDKLLLFPFSA